MESDRETPTPITEPTETPIARRRFVLWAAAAAVVAACDRVLTDASISSDSVAARRDTQIGVSRLQAFAGYPIPAYLPPNYKLTGEEDDRPDGFRDVTSQLAVVYHGPRAPVAVVPSATRYPLLFFATKDGPARFAGTENTGGVEYPLKFADGTMSTAFYFDGMWEPVRTFGPNGERIRPPTLRLHWNRMNLHALVYRWKEFNIGIRASRLCGVPFHEMLRVASSISNVV